MFTHCAGYIRDKTALTINQSQVWERPLPPPPQVPWIWLSAAVWMVKCSFQMTSPKRTEDSVKRNMTWEEGENSSYMSVRSCNERTYLLILPTGLVMSLLPLLLLHLIVLSYSWFKVVIFGQLILWIHSGTCSVHQINTQITSKCGSLEAVMQVCWRSSGLDKVDVRLKWPKSVRCDVR